MLIVETIARIRREHRDGKPIKEIAGALRLSRNTVRKAIRAPEADFSYERKEQPRPRTWPFRERLDELLAQTRSRPAGSGCSSRGCALPASKS